LLDSRADKVICAPVNSSYDGLATQVPVGADEGLEHDSCLNCDQLVLIEKSRLRTMLDRYRLPGSPRSSGPFALRWRSD